MKTGALILIGLVLAAIAYQALERVPADALSVILGVACGIGTMIPVTIGLVVALLRQRERNETFQAAEPEYVMDRTPAPIPAPPISAQTMSPQPQIIVLTPQGQFVSAQMPQGVQMPQWQNSQYPFMHEQANTVDAREWRIIGEE